MPSQTTKSWANIPSYLQPSTTGPTGSFTQLAGAQQQFPSIAQIPGQIPTLDVPNLTPDQLALIQQLMSQGASNPNLLAAQQQLQQLTSGQIGSSPATQEAMKAYQAYTQPQIESQAALAGRGNGGALIEALQQGQQSALVPLLQQEIQNRQGAIGQYQAQAQGQLQQLASALEAAGMPRDVAQQQAQAAFDAQQQKVQYESGIQTLPLQLMGQLLQQNQKTHGTMTWEDWASGIGKGLSLSGIFGGG